MTPSTRRVLAQTPRGAERSAAISLYPEVLETDPGRVAADLLPIFTPTIDRTDKDERFTPRWVFDALGETFDLDPASPLDAVTNVPAARVFTRADDGLSQPWSGFVWLNPPFSNSTAWADRMRAHDNGIFLGPFANARWTHDMIGAARVVWLMRDFAFDHPTHAGKRSSMPLAMYALGDRAEIAVTRAARAIPGAGRLRSSRDSRRSVAPCRA